MQIAVVVYPGFTALDAIGPYQVLAHTPGCDVRLVGERPGPVADNARLTVYATDGLDDVGEPDVVVVAGGMPAFERATPDDPFVRWLAAVGPGATWTTSVCTGSLLLGAAGLLRGRAATTHWYAMDRLASFGAVPTSRRVVEDGPVITAAGVSAGLDMGLLLAARLTDRHTAELLQLDLEYAPEPPFCAGTPEQAGESLTAELRALYDAFLRP
jgi:transcriptional regulator GlxA family with amidase domain